jgi:hypothetical protein
MHAASLLLLLLSKVLFVHTARCLLRLFCRAHGDGVRDT